MMRREVLTRLREGGIRGDRGKNGNRIGDMHIELETADHEEPTWEVRSPGDVRRGSKLDRRTRAILTVAAAAAVVVNAGAAWSYWQITGSRTPAAADAGPVELALRGRSDLNVPLRRGAQGNLTVTVANDTGYPVRITVLTRGAGNIVADPEHREAGCHVSQAIEPALHDHESIVTDLIARIGVIDEEPRQIEEPGEIGHHEGHVKGLDPEIEGFECLHGGGF